MSVFRFSLQHIDHRVGAGIFALRDHVSVIIGPPFIAPPGTAPADALRFLRRIGVVIPGIVHALHSRVFPPIEHVLRHIIAREVIDVMEKHPGTVIGIGIGTAAALAFRL